MSYLLAVLAWAEAHPVFATVVFWPIFSGLVTAVLKPRSAEEYALLAAKAPVTAKVLRLIAALGLDAPKVVQVVRDLAKGTRPPTPPAAGLLIAMALVAAGGTAGCASWQQGAKTALDVLQLTCILAHQDLPDSDVAKVCDIATPLIGPMRSVLASSRQASAKAAADAAAKAGAARCVAKDPGQ